VVHELFLNETTKYADIVIPAKFDIETNDLICPYYIPGISITQAGPCPYPDCLSNHELFQKIAQKMGWSEEIFFESDESIVEHCINLLPSDFRKDIRGYGYHLLFSPEDIPFRDYNFPTINGKINATGPHFKFGGKELKIRMNRDPNQFLLITPHHPYFLHSQFEQIHPEHLKDFNRVFLNLEDIKSLNIEAQIGEKVMVSNEYGNGKYILNSSGKLKSGMALIYSGPSSSNEKNVNSNFFTPNKPEELGLSGSFNSAIVKIRTKMHDK
ncbi:MAG: hypothetical protein GY870_14550, partial [archaeon]|nr:hypothetical protein [archaeon]